MRTQAGGILENRDLTPRARRTAARRGESPWSMSPRPPGGLSELPKSEVPPIMIRLPRFRRGPGAMRQTESIDNHIEEVN